VGDLSSVSVEMWVAPVPLTPPVVTPAGTFDTYHHLVVIASDGSGARGWGLAAAVTAEDLAVTVERARELLDAMCGEADGLLAAERLDAADASKVNDRHSRWAACALSTAGWDLEARLAGVRCADMWAGDVAPIELDCYASGLFLSTPDEALATEARAVRAAGYGKVKMRTGHGVERDLERLAVVRVEFREPGAIAVDAVNAWEPQAARSFIDRAGDLLWVEDPVPLGVIAELRGVPGLVAAGESLTSLADLEALHATGAVGAMLLDVQQIGGPQRFLDAARRLGAAGARVGSHIFTHVSVHLLAAIDDPLPVEAFDWSDPLCLVAPTPSRTGMLAVTGPGLGVEPDLVALARLGTRIM
jgi:L-alanine-DL-glutamate epimerase-like enolase superfamily enzyme